MNLVLPVFQLFRHLLLPLVVTAVAVLAVLVVLSVWEHVRSDASLRRRRHVEARHRPTIERAVLEADWRHAIDELGPMSSRDRRIVADLLLGSVRALGGTPVDNARALAEALGLTAGWRADLDDRRWWRRAEAAWALGTLRDPSASAALLILLDDTHEEVRAAAVEALGRLRDPDVAPALLARLPNQSRHQRVRLIEALRLIGPLAGKHTLDCAERDPSLLPLVADLLPHVSGASALDQLLRWSGDAAAEVRSAAMYALGTIGLDERSFYYALRALSDGDASVRAAGARALGRSRRAEAAPYLAARLNDEWEVAASSAKALAGLGETGRAVLERRGREGGPGAELARQMLWSSGSRTAPAAPTQAAPAA